MTNDNQPKRNKGGRPRTRLGAPKSACFTARLSQEIKDGMTVEAERTGRSIADVAEIWLEQAMQIRQAEEIRRLRLFVGWIEAEQPELARRTVERCGLTPPN